MAIKLILTAIIVVLSTVVFLLVQVLITLNGKELVPAPPGHAPYHCGKAGPALSFLVIGDSTAVSVGGEYDKGIAVSAAQHLGRTYQVSMVNLAVSGATVPEVCRDQLPLIRSKNPDIVLISAGANDVTHFTTSARIRASLVKIIAVIRTKNPRAQIVVTGSPDMGSIPRFPVPLRWIAGMETGRVNRVFARLVADDNLIWAPIARDTGKIFAQHRNYFAADNFHPNGQGYAVWVPVINRALDKAVAKLNQDR